MRISIKFKILLTLASVPILYNACSASDTPGLGNPAATATFINPSTGVTWHVATYEAEAASRSSAAVVVGADDQSDRSVGNLGGEASGRQAVTLTNVQDSISFKVRGSEAGANAIVIRYSIPDAHNGGGASGSMKLSILDANNSLVSTKIIQLTSRYAWVYGGVSDGTKLYNSPSDALAYTGSKTDSPRHVYDEIQLFLNTTLQAGYQVILQKTSMSAVSTISVDFIDLEIVPSPLQQPKGYLSVTDPSCGAIASDLYNTGFAFDGVDDSSYASVFNASIGINPKNPSSFRVQEKDWYSSSTSDVLQDNQANATTGMGLFALADHNLKSLQTCIGLVTAANSKYGGLYIPAGRFYVRGVLTVPSNLTIQGAGMWYSKFVAVDTDSPVSVTYNGVTGIWSNSGNLVITSSTSGSDSVHLSNFSMFGNVTQRDTVDSVPPWGVHGVFSHSSFDNLWIEHYFIGMNFSGSSNAVTVTDSRVRNTFADGLDFYGSTSNSSMSNCSARSTGDDGFALWAQGTTLSTISTGNTVSNSVSQLEWYGNGFSIYGGNGNSFSNLVASDILSYPCIQISTQFVSKLLPGSAGMTAAASGLQLNRCGGNAFSQGYGALLIGSDTENIDGVQISNVNIDNPSYSGLDIRPVGGSGSVSNLQYSHIEIVNPILPAASYVSIKAGVTGSAELSNVCSCATRTSTPQTSAVSNGSSSTFSVVNTAACSQSNCN